MLNESHRVSLGTDSRVAEPSSSLIQHFSDGIFKAAQSAELTHHGEVCPIRRPVCPLYVFQDFARGAAAQRHSAQCARVSVRIDVVTI